jgi:predicted phage tail component-like protein
MKRKMIFDGVILDETIPGFRTLSVSGRQFNDIKIESLDNPGDGSTFLSSRIPERTLTVDFMLKPSNITMMDAQNVLLSYLNQDEPKRLIFTDEPDIYFNAVYSDYKITEEHDKVRSGTIEFVCHDPFKHSTSTKTYTATSTDGTLTANVINNGNVAVPIDYKIVMNSDNGYIGIVSDQGAMQYGLVEEADGEDYTQNEQLATLSDLANAADDHGAEAQHPYASYGTAGTLAMGKAGGQSNFLVLSSVGDNTKTWNGGMKTLTLPADSEGNTGATDFYSYFHIYLATSSLPQTGQMTLSFLTADDTPICGVNWYKTDKVGNTGHYEIWAYDSTATATGTKNALIRVLKNWSYQCNHLSTENPWYWNWGHCDIKKEGSKITFYYWGKYYTYDLPEVADMACAKVQLAIMDVKNRTDDLALHACGMDVFKFQKMHVSKWKDVPNRYSSGNVMTISGDEGKMCINDMPKMGDEVTGTKYFKAEPGTNTIEIYNSTWADDVTAEITIREAWL